MTIDELEKPLLVGEFSVVVVVVSKELTEEEVVDTCVWLDWRNRITRLLNQGRTWCDMTSASLEW